MIFDSGSKYHVFYEVTGSEEVVNGFFGQPRHEQVHSLVWS